MEYKDQGETRRFQSYSHDRKRRRQWDAMRPDQAAERRRTSAEKHAEIEAEKKGGTLLVILIVLALASYGVLMFLSGK